MPIACFMADLGGEHSLECSISPVNMFVNSKMFSVGIN